MPRLIAQKTDSVATLADLVDFCRSSAFDPTHEEGIAAAAPALRALGNNRTFLADLALDALKENCAGQLRANSYSPQVILLHASETSAPGTGFFLRANIWPSPADPAMRTGDPASFFYRAPHDHAFDFLTLGYFGPGYWSDYYEIEPGSLAGLPGERADLRFVERGQLREGRMLLYRANRDVHDQSPPESLSVSVNVMPLSPAQAWRRQYLFDLSTGRIVQDLTVSAAELMLGLAVRIGAGNGRDLAERFMARHPDPRMRLAAWAALDDAREMAGARADLAGRAAASDCALLAGHGRRALAMLGEGSAKMDRVGLPARGGPA